MIDDFAVLRARLSHRPLTQAEEGAVRAMQFALKTEPKVDPRWHVRFALLPKKIGDRVIWLERYRWRRADREEWTGSRPHLDWLFMSPGVSESFQLFQCFDGYVALRRKSICLGALFSTTLWKRPAPQLRAVGE